MIPDTQTLTAENVQPEEKIMPSKTYAVNFEKGCVEGFAEGLDALKQAIFCRLMTEKGIFKIFSSDYGLPFNDLLGQSAPLVYVLIADAVKTTLLEDDRISDVTDFVFNTGKKDVAVSFNVMSQWGESTSEEVIINV